LRKSLSKENQPKITIAKVLQHRQEVQEKSKSISRMIHTCYQVL